MLHHPFNKLIVLQSSLDLGIMVGIMVDHGRSFINNTKNFQGKPSIFAKFWAWWDDQTNWSYKHYGKCKKWTKVWFVHLLPSTPITIFKRGRLLPPQKKNWIKLYYKIVCYVKLLFKTIYSFSDFIFVYFIRIAYFKMCKNLSMSWYFQIFFFA